MNVENFDRVYKLGKDLCSCINANQSEINMSLANTDITFTTPNGVIITLGERKNIANKIALFTYNPPTKSRSWQTIEYFKYRKPCKKTEEYPKQRPSLDKMFNILLEHNLKLTHDEIDKMESVLDLYENKIYVTVHF